MEYSFLDSEQSRGGGKKDKSPVHAKQIACLICIWLIGHGP